LTPIIFLGVLLLFVWLLLIQPQRRRQAAAKRMVEEVAVGSEILTAGGIYATVTEVREANLTVEIAPGTSVRLDKRAVALVLSEAEEAEEDEDEAQDEEPLELPEPAAQLEPAADEETSPAGRT
jgi:preprotein translocase subunit YajC